MEKNTVIVKIVRQLQLDLKMILDIGMFVAIVENEQKMDIIIIIIMMVKITMKIYGSLLYQKYVC